jgi:hypothetical protein
MSVKKCCQIFVIPSSLLVLISFCATRVQQKKLPVTAAFNVDFVGFSSFW